MFVVGTGQGNSRVIVAILAGGKKCTLQTQISPPLPSPAQLVHNQAPSLWFRITDGRKHFQLRIHR